FQTKRNEIHARQTELMENAGKEGRTLDDEEKSEYDSLDTELKHVDDHLERLRKLVGEDTTKKNETKPKGRTILVSSQDQDDAFEGQSFVRRVIARALAQLGGFEQTPAQIAEIGRAVA